MKHLAWVFIVCLFTGYTFGAPVYRAGKPEPAAISRYLHGEVSAAYQFSNSYLEDYLGQVSSERLHGWSARALWSPLSWLSVGAEYTRWGNVSLQQAVVDAYRVSQVGAVFKLTLSPDTNPRLYLVGGYGRSTQRLQFSAYLSNTTYTQPYWMAGLGVETDVYRALFLAAEGNLYWNRTQYIHPYYKLSGHAYGVLQVRAGVRF